MSKIGIISDEVEKLKSQVTHVEEIVENIVNEIYDLDGNWLLTNDTRDYEGDHYWNLGIETTSRPNAKNNTYTETTLIIEDDKFRDDLYEALSHDNDLSDVQVNGNEVTFKWK